MDASGAIEFGWFGRDDLAAVVYLPAQVVAGRPGGRAVPEPRLHAVALTVTAAEPAGLLRGLAVRVASRFFPFPPFLSPTAAHGGLPRIRDAAGPRQRANRRSRAVRARFPSRRARGFARRDAPPTAVKPSADAPQDVSDDDDDDTDSDAQDDSEERGVLATLELDDGGGALRVANVVMSPSDGVDVSPILKNMLLSVEMPHGTPRCKFQVVLRLWRPQEEAE